MNRHLLSLIGILACVPGAEARLGETEAECLQRYGPSRSDSYTRMRAQSAPLLPGAAQKSWDYQGWRITAAFHPTTAKAVRVEYIKSSKPDASRYIEDYEFKAILEANGGAANWKQHSERTGLSPTKALERQLVKVITGPNYRRVSDGATVTYSKRSISLTLELPAAAELTAPRKATNEAQQRATVPKF